MDPSELILTKPVLPPSSLEQLSAARRLQAAKGSNAAEPQEVSDQRKVQLARDFESVLLERLFDQMKNTVGDWGLEKDGASEQVQGLFWLYLARDIADKGGFGLWEDIYQFLKDVDMGNAAADSLDEAV